MALYLCGTAALDVMRYLRSTNDGLIPGDRALPRHLGGALHTNTQLNELSSDAQRLLGHVRGKIEAMVPRRQFLTSTSRLQTRLWSSQIAPGSFINLHNGVYLSSPHFLFLQLAPSLSVPSLAMLGLELCGFFSLWRLPEPFLSLRTDEDFWGATYNLQPATTASKLSAYVRRMNGEYGVAQARSAVRYVLDAAASPMEAAVYLLLCQPRHVGGRGLPAPVFNARVSVSTSTTHEVRYPDLFWPAHGLDVEYQSDFAHYGEWSRHRDSQREIELEAEKITVLPLTRAQAMDPDGFNAFAVSVRRILGVRSRPLAPDWRSNYLDLRKAVLFGAR